MKHRSHGAPAPCLKSGLIIIMIFIWITLNTIATIETLTACNNSTDHLNYLMSVQKCSNTSKNCNKPFQTCKEMNWPKAITTMIGVKVHSDGQAGASHTVSLAPKNNRAVETVSITFNTSKLPERPDKDTLSGPRQS